MSLSWHVLKSIDLFWNKIFEIVIFTVFYYCTYPNKSHWDVICFCYLRAFISSALNFQAHCFVIAEFFLWQFVCNASYPFTCHQSHLLPHLRRLWLYFPSFCFILIMNDHSYARFVNFMNLLICTSFLTMPLFLVAGKFFFQTNVFLVSTNICTKLDFIAFKVGGSHIALLLPVWWTSICWFQADNRCY